MSLILSRLSIHHRYLHFASSRKINATDSDIYAKWYNSIFYKRGFCCRTAPTAIAKETIIPNSKSRQQSALPKLRKELFDRRQFTSMPQSPSNSKNVELRENIYTIPNALTLGRILLSPVIGLCIVNHFYDAGLSLLILAGISDALDGWIARKWNMTTAIGSVLDPAADKILMTCLVVSLSYTQLLPASLGVLILGRDVALALRTAYYRYQTLSPPKTWSRYWDFSLVSAEVKPPFISKLNTVLQLALMAATLAVSAGFGSSGLWLTGLQLSVAITTIWSGLYYFLASGTMKLIKK